MIDYSTLLENQRTYFKSGATRSASFRIRMLKTLYEAIVRYEDRLYAALHEDLNKAAQEAYNTEIGPALAEIGFQRKHLKSWMQPKPVPGMLFSFPSSAKVYAEPYGSVLVLAPWNYPFWLSFVPLAGALAAGNCVILKPSELAPATATVMQQLIAEFFDPAYITVLTGDVSVSEKLLELQFDYIFFTGSTPVGSIIAQSAAKKLIPYTLELGGKSPCIVDKDADVQLAALRLLWGKTINSGQSCVAPDYLFVHHSIADKLITAMEQVLKKFYPDGALNYPGYPRIISERHYQRLKRLLGSGGKVLLGGKSIDEKRLMEPTVLGEVGWHDAVMKEEIFGPLLPIIRYDDLSEVINQLNAQPKPLALYIFSNNRKTQQRIIREVPFGGGLINDTIEHLGNHYLPFGGIGGSGQGAYHGKFSFDTFSHRKGVMKKGTWLDIGFRYPPYKKSNFRLAKFFLR